MDFGLILIKSYRNQIVYTIFRLIQNQTDVRLVPNQSVLAKYNLITVLSNRIWKIFPCVPLGALALIWPRCYFHHRQIIALSNEIYYILNLLYIGNLGSSFGGISFPIQRECLYSPVEYYSQFVECLYSLLKQIRYANGFFCYFYIHGQKRYGIRTYFSATFAFTDKKVTLYANGFFCYLYIHS